MSYCSVAEEIEIRFFGVPNAVGRVNRVKTERGQNEQAQQDVNEEDVQALTTTIVLN